MNNLTSYCVLVDAKLRASDKDSPVLKVSKFENEIMKSSFLPKYEQKIVKISALAKGQLILKCLFGVMDQIATKLLSRFLP